MQWRRIALEFNQKLAKVSRFLGRLHQGWEILLKGGRSSPRGAKVDVVDRGAPPRAGLQQTSACMCAIPRPRRKEFEGM